MDFKAYTLLMLNLFELVMAILLGLTIWLFIRVVKKEKEEEALEVEEYDETEEAPTIDIKEYAERFIQWTKKLVHKIKSLFIKGKHEREE